MTYQAQFFQQGNTLDLASDVPLRQGQIVRVGKLTGVTVRALPQEHIDRNRKAAWRVDGGWILPKAIGTAVGGGVPIWWDEASESVSLTSGVDLIPFGYSFPEGAAAEEETVKVLLVPGAVLE